MATVLLTLFKLGVAYASGSVGVLSEGVHSFLDVISAGLSFFTVQAAIKPADEDHPFGHGKIETLSSLFESLLLVVAAALIVMEGVDHVRNPHPIQFEWLAISSMLVSAGVSYVVYRHNLKASQLTESTALRVNALHFLSDIVASLGILVGLVLIKLTGWYVLDALMAFLVAAYIVAISLSQVKGALAELADAQLPEQEIREIRDILASVKNNAIEAHDLRTRKSGVTRHMDFHLVVCGKMTVERSHEVCDEIEARLLERFPAASVNIHVEPCGHHKTGCEKFCEEKMNVDRGSNV